MISNTSPYWIVGTGRCGTTVLMLVIQKITDFLVVDEPNFLSFLYFPIANGIMSPKYLLDSLNDEGWRGATKISRVLIRDYSHYFGNDGYLPIRALLKMEFEELNRKLSLGHLDFQNTLITSANRIIRLTSQASSSPRWVIKQPSAITDWKMITSWWPNSKFIVLFRSLPHVINSRLKRGFQSTFESALAVCETRLEAAILMIETLPREQVLKLRIEDIVKNPKRHINLILSFFEYKDVVSQPEYYVNSLSSKALYELGDPYQSFNSSELFQIECLREKVNNKLKGIWI